MDYFVVTLVGFIGGCVCTLIAFEAKRKILQQQHRRQKAQAEQIEQARRAVESKQISVDARITELSNAEATFGATVVSYKELQDENGILKRDLRNVDLTLRKVQLDRDVQHQNQHAIDERTKALAGRYLKENVKWIVSSLTPTNFATGKQRLHDVVERCRGIGFDIPAEEETALVENLKTEFAKVVRAAFDREEQARIRAQIREEQAREKEVQRVLKQLEHEREAIKQALEKALAEAKDQHSAEVDRLTAMLEDAEERSRRAMSQAQLTKSGHVYVISNIGSFGENVFKVGMTRRLEPLERIDELGSASVPFPFDVHMMVACNDAPALENALHRKLFRQRINKARPRKEFFKVELERIAEIVKEQHGEIEYVAEPPAEEYHDSLKMSADDQEFVESVYDSLEHAKAVAVDDE